MRSKLLRVTIACVAFVAGVGVASIYRNVQQQRSVAQAELTAPSPTATPIHEEMYPAYPETWGITPREIESFIDAHPNADLNRLWQRLGITDEGDPMVQFSFNSGCGLCEANIFEFNLDDDVEREVVLQIRQEYGEMYRYLIFNDDRDLNSKFLGTINVRSKYRPSDPLVLVSNHQAWLIVQETGATGSGLGAWVDSVYEVSDSGIRRVASYLSEVRQMGDLGFPTKTFVGRLVSCDIEKGWATLKVSYTVEYFGSTHLFTKQKTAVLGNSLRVGSPFVIAGQSEITPYEFETIYNFDSMGEDDFLTFNRDELRAIATGRESEKKAWLKEFLDTCEDSPIKRELLRLLS